MSVDGPGRSRPRHLPAGVGMVERLGDWKLVGRGVAQSGSASALGAESRGFKSRRPDCFTDPATRSNRLSGNVSIGSPDTPQQGTWSGLGAESRGFKFRRPGVHPGHGPGSSGRPSASRARTPGPPDGLSRTCPGRSHRALAAGTPRCISSLSSLCCSSCKVTSYSRTTQIFPHNGKNVSTVWKTWF